MEKKKSKLRIREARNGLLFITPWIFGFLVFMFTMITSIIGTWKNINLVCDKKSTELNDVKAALAVSFAIQFFVLLYGMTGNPIYDSTFCFYAVAVAINISFSMNMRGKI